MNCSFSKKCNTACGDHISNVNKHTATFYRYECSSHDISHIRAHFKRHAFTYVPIDILGMHLMLLLSNDTTALYRRKGRHERVAF